VKHDWYLLHVACAIAKNTHNLEIIKLLLENGADINAATEAGWTPLHIAVYQDIPIIIPTLIANGADTNCKSWAGDTPLGVAKRLGRKDVIDVLNKEIEQQNIR
jgi:ankyrin repeat protein